MDVVRILQIFFHNIARNWDTWESFEFVSEYFAYKLKYF